MKGSALVKTIRQQVSHSFDSFNAEEKSLISAYRTPYQVQQFLNRLRYNREEEGETLHSFRWVLRHEKAHCLEAALTAAVILEQHGYPPLLLDLASEDGLDHVLFLYRKDGRWGTVARSRDPGLHGRKPVFKTLPRLVESYAEPYVDFTGRIVGFGVTNLGSLGNYDWRLSERNVWKVERHLNEIPHKPFRMPQAQYLYWLERYRRYRQRYPDRKPLFYADRRTWTPGYPKNS